MEADVNARTPHAARPLNEDVRTHAVMRTHRHPSIERVCGYHSRLGIWTFDGLHECLLDHPEPTRTRKGDQILPSGDEAIEDDQSLIIKDIEARRQVGIERYGQGHRPFNGRDTLQDLYEEQLDLLVYLRSIKRMSEATRADLIHVVEEALTKFQEEEYGVVIPELPKDVAAEIAVDRIMGWVVGQHIIQEESDATV